MTFTQTQTPEGYVAYSDGYPLTPLSVYRFTRQLPIQKHYFWMFQACSPMELA